MKGWVGDLCITRVFCKSLVLVLLEMHVLIKMNKKCSQSSVRTRGIAWSWRLAIWRNHATGRCCNRKWTGAHLNVWTLYYVLIVNPFHASFCPPRPDFPFSSLSSLSFEFSPFHWSFLISLLRPPYSTTHSSPRNRKMSSTDERPAPYVPLSLNNPATVWTCIDLNPSLRLGSTAPNFQADTTNGPIDFHEFIGSQWVVLFSHPEDYTPVCTTELGAFAKLEPEFTKRGVKLIGLSANTIDSHGGWIKDIDEISGSNLKFPIIGDKERKVAYLYDMLDHQDTTNVDQKGIAFTIRSVFIIDPKKTIRLILSYPASTGRNTAEVLRVVDSLQTGDKHKVTTPINWVPGMIPRLFLKPLIRTDSRLQETMSLCTRAWRTNRPRNCSLISRLSSHTWDSLRCPKKRRVQPCRKRDLLERANFFWGPPSSCISQFLTRCPINLPAPWQQLEGSETDEKTKQLKFLKKSNRRFPFSCNVVKKRGGRK